MLLNVKCMGAAPVNKKQRVGMRAEVHVVVLDEQRPVGARRCPLCPEMQTLPIVVAMSALWQKADIPGSSVILRRHSCRCAQFVIFSFQKFDAPLHLCQGLGDFGSVEFLRDMARAVHVPSPDLEQHRSLSTR